MTMKRGSVTIKRRSRKTTGKRLYARIALSTDSETIGDLEYETNEEKFIGRGNLGLPNMVKNSIPLSKKIGLVTEPIVSLKRTVKVKPGEETIVDFILAVGEEKEKVKENLQKYQSSENVKAEFELSKARVEAESRYLRMKGKEIEIYQKMLSYIIFDNPVKSQTMQKNCQISYKQEELWKYGISGDLPILLVKIKDINDIDIIKEVLSAYEFFRVKNIKVDLVILNEEKESYENYVKDAIQSAILNKNIAYLLNIPGGIFCLENVDKKDKKLLETRANLVINASYSSLALQMEEIENKIIDNVKETVLEVKPNIIAEVPEDKEELIDMSNLKYFNEYGGFSKDGKEYCIKINTNNKLPTVWSHVLANKNFGTLTTENMGGYTWYKNSRLNRVTSWHNSTCTNIPSEIIYLKDEENGRIWTPTAMPMPDDKNYNVIYGFGYAKYVHSSDDILQELEIFVPQEESCKINILTLKNNAPKKKKIKIVYYVKPVIGEDEIKSDGYIKLQYEENSNVLIAKNLYNTDEFKDTIYVSSSEKIKSFTGNKKAFLGSVSNPSGLHHMRLDNDSGIGKKSCIAIEIEVEIESFSDKKISIILGADETLVAAKDVAYKYSKVQNCNMELSKVKSRWNEFLGKLQVKTPYESLNIMLNGWIMYQTITSRLLAKSGFYQSGGAYGFRDQLQDVYGIKFLDSNILYNQIIKHSKHQFVEGDVEHWWHEENNRGIRTKFSDDLLWLPYMVVKYINHTGDYNILNVVTPYLQGPVLQENEKEKYIVEVRI